MYWVYRKRKVAVVEGWLSAPWETTVACRLQSVKVIMMVDKAVLQRNYHKPPMYV